MTVSVAVSGAGGKLATPIVTALTDADGVDLVALYNPNRVGQEMGGLTIVGDPGAVKADVVVETVHPDHVLANLELWREAGSAAVVGTSGFTPDRLETLKRLWGTQTPCLVVPNFSIGAVLMMQFAEQAASHFDAVEVIERHHSSKPDAPSGTALATAIGIRDGGGSSVGGSAELVEGARGGLVEGVRVHSLRLPGVISHQEVALGNPGEMLSITHLSTSYESFAAGAVLAALRVGTLPGGVHLGLDEIL